MSGLYILFGLYYQKPKKNIKGIRFTTKRTVNNHLFKCNLSSFSLFLIYIPNISTYMIHSDYYVTNNNQYFFSQDEWRALDASAITAGSISILFSLFVLVLHSFIVLKKDGSANRLSIRMIIIACVCNIVYCTLQIVSCQIHSTVFACHILVHLIMATDTMACMALAMIGFNLVVIFIFKVSKRIKVDLFYYGVVLLSGILTFSIPLILRIKKKPTQLPSSYCWYHYYFEGRMNGLFNWVSAHVTYLSLYHSLGSDISFFFWMM
jgi:hypothetical protein